MTVARKAGAVLALAGGFALAMGATVPALAADPGTKVVAWVVTSGDFNSRFSTPQTLYTGDLDCTTTTTAIDLQVDTYRYATDQDKATVDTLIQQGTLASANDDGSVYLSNVDVVLQPCATTGAPSSPSTAAATSSPTSSPTSTPTSTPTATASTPPATPTPTSPQSAPSTPGPTATTGALTSGSTRPLDSSAARQLAFTGFDAGPWIGGGAASVVAGLCLLAWSRRRAS